MTYAEIKIADFVIKIGNAGEADKKKLLIWIKPV